MKIKLHEIKVKDLFKGYKDNDEEGVVAYRGDLDIRPPYQREFVYKDKERNAVIDTVNKGFPLNIMYWVEKEDGTYEVLDGQQRTLSICQYINGDFSIRNRNFFNLTDDEQEKILNYKLMIYFCTGTDSEKLGWFRTVNISGEKLKNQELRNSVYSGTWLTDAKRYFSKKGGPACGLAGKILNGSANRQDYLETALDWISHGNIEGYMSLHQHDKNANELWLYFNKVVDWVYTLFPNYKKEMKGRPWGFLYNKYSCNAYDSGDLEKKVNKLMLDDEVENNKGIYEYLFDNDLKHLSLRTFSLKQKRIAYEKQNGICKICGNKFKYQDMEGDHIKPWTKGGKTNMENLQMLCKKCNREKSDKY